MTNTIFNLKYGTYSLGASLSQTLFDQYERIVENSHSLALLKKLRAHVQQFWNADDSTAGGKLEQNQQQVDNTDRQITNDQSTLPSETSTSSIPNTSTVHNTSS